MIYNEVARIFRWRRTQPGPMYPEMQSALFAEVSTFLMLLNLLALMILLAGLALLYRSFREKYLVPWITGWALYTLSKMLVAAGGTAAGPGFLGPLGVISFVLAAGLFAIAVLGYVQQPRYLMPAVVGMGVSALLGGVAGMAENPPVWLLAALFLSWHLVVWLAVFQLAKHCRGRISLGPWLLIAALLLLHLDRFQPRHAFLGRYAPYDLLVDLMLGIGMMMVVLDESRVKIERLNILHRIDRVISECDELDPVIDAALAELMRTIGARSAWFRIVKGKKLQIVVQRGLAEAAAQQFKEIDDATSTSGRALRAGEVSILSLEETPNEFQGLLKEQGVHHMVMIPVTGKSARIGILLLGQRHPRSYSNDEKQFLKSAANRLGLAAENRQLMMQLVDSHNEWASAFNSISDYVLVHDSQFNMLRANQALLERLGMTYTQIILKPCEMVLPGGGSAWKGCPYCDLSQQPREDDPCFSGYTVVSSSAYSGRDSASGTVHVIKDVTGARAAEERYKVLFDHMQEGVFVSSPEGRILDCNEAFLRMLGYSSREEMQKLDAATNLYANAADRTRFLEEMARHGFVRNFEYVLRRKDGRNINVIESSFASRAAGGAIERYQGVVLDVTDKKLAEDEVRRRNRELHLLNNIAVIFNQSFNLDEILQLAMLQVVDLFSTDTAAVYVFDESTSSMCRKAGCGHRSVWAAENKIVALPEEFLDLIRKNKMEMVTHHDLQLMPDVVKKYVEVEGLNSWIWVLVLREEKILGMMGTSSREAREFTPSEKRVLLAVSGQLAATIEKIQLYEETRKAYENLRRTQEQLLQSEKMSAVGQMISGVAHELNNPLTAILGYAQLLETEDLDPRVREYIVKLEKQAHRTQKIVQNLLSFSRQHKPQRSHVDLRNVMEDTLALRDFALKAGDITVDRHFQEELPFVVADPHQLEQVFLNIINNAADAMLEVSNHGTMRIEIYSDQQYAVVEFHDTGPGISDPKRVFDPFYTTKSIGKGTGLGLSICYGIVKEHGGEISAQNHPQGGALVRIKLPVAGADKPVSERDHMMARREPQLSGRVLLVDAEQSVLDFEREILATSGLEVATLTSGEKVIELLKYDSFDVIFIDSKIRGPMSSDEVFEWIQKSRPDLSPRTVMMRYSNPDADVRVFVYSSKILCLVKPFEVSDLLGVVRRVLRDTKPAPTVQ